MFVFGFVKSNVASAERAVLTVQALFVVELVLDSAIVGVDSHVVAKTSEHMSLLHSLLGLDGADKGAVFGIDEQIRRTPMTPLKDRAEVTSGRVGVESGDDGGAMDGVEGVADICANEQYGKQALHVSGTMVTLDHCPTRC